MAGEFAAVDSYGNMNVAGLGAQVFDGGYLGDFQAAMGFPAQVIAAPYQILFTPDMVPFGYVNVPLGWDVTTKGFPTGFSVGWDMATGISTIYGLDGSKVGMMFSPLQILTTDIAPLPIAKLSYDVITQGSHVFAKPWRKQLAAVWTIAGQNTGHLLCPWQESVGRNYGGPDGGPSR